MKNFLLSFMLIYLSNIPPAISGQTLSYGPTQNTLRGSIFIRSVYGPPNFGENPKMDKKVNIIILVLERPINVRGDSQNPVNANSFYDISSLQLINFSNKPLYFCLGQRVNVTGQLLEIQNNINITGVSMGVIKIISISSNLKCRVGIRSF